MEKEVTCDELHDLEVGYDHDYINNVPLRMLTTFGLQGYASETFSRYCITRR